MSSPELYQSSLKKGSNMDEHPRSRGEHRGVKHSADRHVMHRVLWSTDRILMSIASLLISLLQMHAIHCRARQHWPFAMPLPVHTL
jgi:hypothetical protein